MLAIKTLGRDFKTTYISSWEGLEKDPDWFKELVIVKIILIRIRGENPSYPMSLQEAIGKLPNELKGWIVNI